MTEEKNAHLMSKISKVVDNWANTVLKKQLISGQAKTEPLGLWDKLKRGISNLWYGDRYERYNPYRWRNRFGDALGVEECFDPAAFTLSEYAEIRRVVDALESRLDEGLGGFENLRIAGMIRSAAEELKVMLFNALKDNFEARPEKKGESGGDPPVSDVEPPPPEGAAGGTPPVPPAGTPAKPGNRRRRPDAAGDGGTPPVPPTGTPAEPGNRRRRPDAAAGDLDSSGLSSIDQDEGSIEVLKALRREQPDLDQLARDWRAYKSLVAVGMAPRLGVVSGSVVEHPSNQPITYKWLSKKVKDHKNHELLPYIFDESGNRMGTKDSIEKIYNFTKSLYSEKDASTTKKLRSWARANLYEAVQNMNKEERDRYIYDNLISRSNFIDAIAEHSKINPEEIKRKMIEFAKADQ